MNVTLQTGKTRHIHQVVGEFFFGDGHDAFPLLVGWLAVPGRP